MYAHWRGKSVSVEKNPTNKVFVSTKKRSERIFPPSPPPPPNRVFRHVLKSFDFFPRSQAKGFRTYIWGVTSSTEVSRFACQPLRSPTRPIRRHARQPLHPRVFLPNAFWVFGMFVIFSFQLYDNSHALKTPLNSLIFEWIIFFGAVWFLFLVWKSVYAYRYESFHFSPRSDASIDNKIEFFRSVQCVLFLIQNKGLKWLMDWIFRTWLNNQILRSESNAKW